MTLVRCSSMSSHGGRGPRRGRCCRGARSPNSGEGRAYVLGPTFEPNGRCFDVDGTLTITLESDGNTISGPLTGVFCPRASETGHQHAGAISYGNPFEEDDSIVFTDGRSEEHTSELQ